MLHIISEEEEIKLLQFSLVYKPRMTDIYLIWRNTNLEMYAI